MSLASGFWGLAKNANNVSLRVVFAILRKCKKAVIASEPRGEAWQSIFEKAVASAIFKKGTNLKSLSKNSKFHSFLQYGLPRGFFKTARNDGAA